MNKDINRKKMKAFLDAYDKALGNVSTACKMVGITRQTFYLWKKHDQSFTDRVDEIDQKNVDFAETMLLKNIREGRETSIIFYLKTKGKERGYVEKTEADVNINAFEKLMQECEDEDE